MKSLLLQSNAKAEKMALDMFELDETLLDTVSGGCSCQDKHVTATRGKDGTVTYSVDNNTQ